MGKTLDEIEQMHWWSGVFLGALGGFYAVVFAEVIWWAAHDDGDVPQLFWTCLTAFCLTGLMTFVQNTKVSRALDNYEGE